ncbi:MAG: alpha/beta hydrolase, partial [Chloroflexota bacterium]
GDAFGVFSILMPNTSFAETHDLVIFNQRGTLYAEPSLRCPEVFEAGLAALADPEDKDISDQLLAYAECYQRLSIDGVDLSAYNSLENAADVDAIRAALGYETFNFYGVSYGTLLGLHLMQNHPDNLRTVILDGVAPPNLNFIPLVPQGTERIFSEMFQACTSNSTCQANYPDLETRFFTLVEQLDNEPVPITLTDTESGRTVDTMLTGQVLMDLMFQVFYLPDAYTIFPKIVLNIESGDYDFLESIWPLFVFEETFSEGMYYSVICAEDADFTINDVPLEGVRPEIAEGAAEELGAYLDICTSWPVEKLPDSVDAPITSDIPTLLLSGQFDPITPPSFAATAAETLPNSYNYVYPTGSHGVAFNNPCIDRIIQDFLADPTREPTSTCLNIVNTPNFAPPDAFSLPLLGQINQLAQGAFIEMGIAGLFILTVLSAYFLWPLSWFISLFRTQARPTRTTNQRLINWSSRGLILMFGAVAALFVAGVTSVIIYILASDTGLAILSAVPSWTTPLFLLPCVLGLLLLCIVGVTPLVWRSSGWTLLGKLYYTVLALSALGYIIVLGWGGMLTILF